MPDSLPDSLHVSSRRSLVLGAAWTAPALVVITAVPAWAVGSVSGTMTVLQTSGNARTRTGTVTLLLDPASLSGTTLTAAVTYSESATPAVCVLTDAGSSGTGELYTCTFTLDNAPFAKHDVAATITVSGYGVTTATVTFDPAGTRDTAFTYYQGTGLDSTVSAVAVQTDGKILAGGQFSGLNGDRTSGLARLGADGTPDPTFNANVLGVLSTTVNAVAVQVDGKILAGGTFTRTSNGATANRLARINEDGTSDTTFDSSLDGGLNNAVNAIAIQADGKILIGGSFTSIGGVTTNRLARLNVDGTLDSAFATVLGTGFNGPVNSIAVQADGKILVGGNFNTLNGKTAKFLVRLDAGGTPDATFTTNQGTGLGGGVNALAVQTDGKILIGGLFSTLNGKTVKSLARLEADGTPDTTFTGRVGVGPNNRVSAIGVQTDGRILVGGNFTIFSGAAAASLTRLGADGTPDTTFGTNLGSGTPSVLALATCSSGALLGGQFTKYDGSTAKYLARIYT